MNKFVCLTVVGHHKPSVDLTFCSGIYEKTFLVFLDILYSCITYEYIYTVRVCICATAFRQAGAAEKGGRSCRQAVCNIMTTAARWPSRMAACVICAPSPIFRQHAVFEPRVLMLQKAALWGSNSGKWVVNTLKCSSTWVYFTPVIRNFPSVCYGGWTEAYCTYRRYFIRVSCCCFCEAATFQSQMSSLLL